MTTTVTEVAPDTYRLTTFHPDFGLQFNQYLVDDEQPFLMHTGMRMHFASVKEAVARVLPPEKLRWIGFSHFESDECGALNDWLAVAPDAQAACGFLAANVNLSDFAARPARALEDGEVLETGRHRLRYLATPHVPHGWDAGLFHDEAEGTLFCSDLFVHGGEVPALVEDDVVGPARDGIVASIGTPFAGDVPYTPRTGPTLERLAALAPRTLALMHGSTFRGDGAAQLRALDGVLREFHGTP